MSTALLRFQEPERERRPSLAVLAAALDACPDAVAIVEDGKLIYTNPSLEQFSAQGGKIPEPGSHTDVSWQETTFNADGRSFSLLTLRPPTGPSDSQHLALIGRLVGGVAHDFHNLLTGILLYCDLMLTRVAPANPLARKIEEIRTAAEQGAGLIRQLMTVGREEKEAPQLVAFNYALREITPLLQRLVGENVQIGMDLGEGDGVVGISLVQAQQIILNLVLNARDASPGGGRVLVKTSSRQFAGTGPASRIFELLVQDYGTGMDAQTAARIFDPFFTTKDPGRGTGMGLTTVRKIVDDAGGIVSVETSPGDGTRVAVRLPEMAAEGAITVAQPEVPSEETSSEIILGKAKRGASL
jgi:two-component system, cell cycle sensor histidine kinase and response regulator CckA